MSGVDSTKQYLLQIGFSSSPTRRKIPSDKNADENQRPYPHWLQCELGQGT